MAALVRLQGPLMLEMGVLPDVAAATSATMILFTSAAAAVVFLSFGGVPPAYAGLAFTVGLLSTAAGQVGVRVQAEPATLEGYALRRPSFCGDRSFGGSLPQCGRHQYC